MLNHEAIVVIEHIYDEIEKLREALGGKEPVDLCLRAAQLELERVLTELSK